MSIEFDTSGPAVSESAVTAFESTLPGPLPADYRAFLLAQNGGDPERNWWPPELGGPDLAVRRFLSIGDVEYWGSLEQHRAMFLGQLAADLLAIGSDDGGALVCLSLAGEFAGSVWFYDPDAEFAPEDPPAPDVLTRVTGSFTELLHGLEPKPDEAEMDRRYDAVDQAGPSSA